ncbi:MAG: hypothetical protein AABW54_00670 [Candidatus Micrarchaeota archaeon]
MNPELLIGQAAKKGAGWVLSHPKFFSKTHGNAPWIPAETRPEMTRALKELKCEIPRVLVQSHLRRHKLMQLYPAVLEQLAGGATAREALEAAGVRQHRELARTEASERKHLALVQMLDDAGRPVHAQEVAAALFAAHSTDADAFLRRINDFGALENLIRDHGLKTAFAGSFERAKEAARKGIVHSACGILNSPQAGRFTYRELMQKMGLRESSINSVITAVSILNRLGFSFELPRGLQEGQARASRSTIGWKHRDTRHSLPRDHAGFEILARLYYADGSQLVRDLSREYVIKHVFSYGSETGVRSQASVHKEALKLRAQGLVAIHKPRMNVPGRITLTHYARRLVADSLRKHRLNEELRQRLLEQPSSIGR